MRLMLIGMDRNLFDPKSITHERIARLGSEYTDALDTIVFSTKKHGITAAQDLSSNTHAYPTNSRSRLWYGWDAIRIARTLPRPDIISTQDTFETGLCGLILSWYWKIPLAVEIHTDFLAPSFIQHSRLNWFRVKLAMFVLRHAKGGYTVAERTKADIQKRIHTPLNLSVLPIYIDTQKFNSVVHQQHPRFKTALLWVGRLEDEKNPRLALEALYSAREKGFDVGLTVAGEGSMQESLMEYVREQGLTKYVEFTGFSNDVLALYAQADLLLVTSAYEGYGMVIVEALASHVPVLSTDVGVARDAGAIIAEGSYADAVVAWLEGPKERGILTLPTYANEDVYFKAVQTHYQHLIS